MIKKENVIIILILLLAFMVRLFRINSNPPSLYWDEISIGYNAYSILLTGKDEYGQFLPITFEAFQDFKLPGYIYAAAVSEFVFGLTELGVRFPSLIFGTLTTVLIYLITQELFINYKNKQKLSLIVSLFFSISPWALQFNRAAFEASGGLFFTLLGIYYLLLWLNNRKYLILSALFFGISFYFYYQQWIFIPLFLVSVILLNKERFLSDIKKTTVAIAVFLIIISPIIYKVSSNKAGRLSHVETVTTAEQIVTNSSQSLLNENNSFTAKIVHHRFISSLLTFIRNYLEYFSLNFLFLYGDSNPRHGVSGMGLNYVWFIPFYLIGISLSLLSKFTNKFIISWLLLAPIAAACTLPSPHALRSLILLPIILIISAYGLIYILDSYKNSLIKLLITSISVYFIFFYLHSYYIHETERSLSWADGYKQLFGYLSSVEKDYQTIYITGKYWRPYIFKLFYQKYPPNLYQENPDNSRIGNYYFGSANYDSTNPRYNYENLTENEIRSIPNSLLVLGPDEVKTKDKIIKNIYTVNNKPVFIIVKN